MAMTVNEKKVKQWLNKLPGFDPEDPKPGHYHIFLCPETNMVFQSREDTKTYTRKTGITDFLSIWAEVQNSGSGKWSIGKIDKNAPTAADAQKTSADQAEYERRKANEAKDKAQRELDEQLHQQREEEIRKKAMEEADAKQRIALQREQEAREKAEAEERARQLKEKYENEARTVTKTTNTFSSEMDNKEKIGPFQRAYGKWVNDKLTRNGYDPIKIDDMLAEFYNGTVLKKLLTCLTPDAEPALVKVDMHPHNRFVVSSSYSHLWNFMTGPENIDLGGINAVNIWGNHPQLKTLLNLIHKLQMKYDNEGGKSALLEWAKPRCAKHKNINNFHDDWADGTAFLALYDSHFGGSLPVGSSKDNLSLAFKKLSDDLGVVALLEPEDFEGDIEDELVTMYVASIKNAMETQKDVAPDARAEAEKLFTEANALSAKYSRETKEHSDQVYNETVVQFDTIGWREKDKIHDVIATAVTSVYDPAEEHFQEAHKLYEQAINKFQELPGNPCQDRVEACTTAMKKSDKLPVKYRKELYESLTKSAKQWEREAMMRDGEYVYKDTCVDTETYMVSVQQYVDEHLPGCKDENARIAVKNTAVKMVEKKATPGFDLAKERYNEAKELCDETHDKLIVDDRIKQVNEKMEHYKREMEHYVTRAVNEIYENQTAEAEDILAIYHQFSVECATYIQCLRPTGQVEDIGDEEVPRLKGQAQYRLEKLLEVVKKSYERDCELRKMLHSGTDALFDKEGLPL